MRTKKARRTGHLKLQTSVGHVLSKYNRQALNYTVVIIYLSVIDAPLESLQFVIQSSPTVVWVYRLRGLPRSIKIVSNSASSLWHFSGILGHSQSRSRFFRRHRKSVPRLIVSASTNTTSIAARASMDLPNTTIAVLDYPKFTNIHQIEYGFKLEQV